MTPGQHVPLIPWATHVIQWRTTTRRNTERWSKSFKSGLSSDRGLQLDLLKLDSLVITGQLYCGEYVLKSCTHRPSTQGNWGYPKSVFIRPTVNSITGSKS
jgi:hypothetical protein